MSNTIIFDKTDPEIANALKGCKVGEEKEITIKIMPTVDDESKLVADITEIVSGYEEGDIIEEEEEPAMAPPSPALTEPPLQKKS